MGRSDFGTDILIAVSANSKETAINTEQTLDTGMLCDMASIPDIEPRRENNADEAHGKEEPDLLYDLGGVSKMKMRFPRCQAQHMALLGSYGLGISSSVAAGTTGWKRIITPISGDLDAARSNPSFTLAARLGKHLQKLRLASMFVTSFDLTMDRDSWVVLEAELNGTGKKSTNLYKETKNAAYNAESLTLAANGIAGIGPAERLANVHHIRVKVPTTEEWVDVVYSAVSDATPAVITITPPGGAATLCDYEIIYNIAEAGDYAWCVFPNRVEEYPLRVSDFLVKIGGKWDGSALAGGHTLQADINSLKWTCNCGPMPDFTSGGGTYQYANRALRNPRNQTVTLDRRFMDAILYQRFVDIEYFSLYAIAEGALYEAGHKYTIEIVWPRVSVKGRPVTVGDKNRLVEAVEFDVMQDDIYGSVVLFTKNMIQHYAQ
jgi:hypothetical protein